MRLAAAPGGQPQEIAAADQGFILRWAEQHLAPHRCPDRT
jgi:hypothetical protein